MGIRNFDADQAIAIQNAHKKLREVPENVIFMEMEQNAPTEDMTAYIQRCELGDEKHAAGLIRFIEYSHTYIFLNTMIGEKI